MTNPPYGARLGLTKEVQQTWGELGNILRRRFLGWTGFALAGDPALAKSIGLRPKRRHIVYNGPMEGRFLEIPIRDAPVARDA